MAAKNIEDIGPCENEGEPQMILSRNRKIE